MKGINIARIFILIFIMLACTAGVVHAQNYTVIMSYGQTPYQLGYLSNGNVTGWTWWDTDGGMQQKNLILVSIMENATTISGLSPPAWVQDSSEKYGGSKSWKAGNGTHSWHYLDNYSSSGTPLEDIVLSASMESPGFLMKIVYWAQELITGVNPAAVVPTSNLTFWTNYNMTDNHGYVKASVDRGVTWDTLDDYSGNSGGWVEKSLNLTDYSGQQILLAFYFSSNSENDDEWWIDDIVLTSNGVDILSDDAEGSSPPALSVDVSYPHYDYSGGSFSTKTATVDLIEDYTHQIYYGVFVYPDDAYVGEYQMDFSTTIDSDNLVASKSFNTTLWGCQARGCHDSWTSQDDPSTRNPTITIHPDNITSDLGGDCLTMCHSTYSSKFLRATPIHLHDIEFGHLGGFVYGSSGWTTIYNSSNANIQMYRKSSVQRPLSQTQFNVSSHVTIAECTDCHTNFIHDNSGSDQYLIAGSNSLSGTNISSNGIHATNVTCEDCHGDLSYPSIPAQYSLDGTIGSYVPEFMSYESVTKTYIIDVDSSDTIDVTVTGDDVNYGIFLSLIGPIDDVTGLQDLNTSDRWDGTYSVLSVDGNATFAEGSKIYYPSGDEFYGVTFDVAPKPGKWIARIFSRSPGTFNYTITSNYKIQEKPIIGIPWNCSECHNPDASGLLVGANTLKSIPSWDNNGLSYSHTDINDDGKDDITCRSCHDSMHDISIRDCVSCHTKRPGGHNMPNYFSMKYSECLGCHKDPHYEPESAAGGNCTDCHLEGGANASSDLPMINNSFLTSVHYNITGDFDASNYSAISMVCWGCHANYTEQLIDPSHTKPVSELPACEDCHFNNTPLNGIYLRIIPPLQVIEHQPAGEDIQTNSSVGCLACHNLTDMKEIGAPVDKNGLNLVSHYAKNYTTISSLRNNINSTDYCLACHNNTNSIFYNASIITKTTTHGTNCSSCHSAGMIHDSNLSSYSGEGISDCLDCHSNTGSNKFVNATLFTQSVHSNLNSEATNTSALNFNSSKACWSCHGNGTQPSTHLTNLTEVRTCYDTVYCHGNITLNVGVSEHFLSGDNIKALTGEANDVDSCIACHNQTDMKVTGTPTTGTGLYSVSHFGKNYTTISSLRSTTNTTDYCTACHFNATSIFKPFIDTSGEHGIDCDGCHGIGKIHDANLGVPSMNGNSSECLGCHDGLSNKSVSSNEYTRSVHAPVNCIDCHTPRQVFKGIIVNQESRIYNFTMISNITSLNAILEWEGGSTLGLTLHSPNGTNYGGNSINISSPQAGDWSAVVRDLSGDAPFTLTINVTMKHGILMAKDCEDCHITGFSTTPIVFKHLPQQSNVPTDASCISCHESKLLAATAMGTSHYAPRVTLDTKDCIQCHNGDVDGWGNAPDQRNHTDFAFVSKTLSVDTPWELVDNYTITLIETTTSAAMIDIKKDGVLLKREVAGLGDDIKYEISGLGIDDTAIINITVDQLFTAEGSYVVELSGYMLSSHIHRETQNEQCYSCHDNEYRSNMPDGMDYYVLDKDLENVTLMEMPVNFTDSDKKTIAMGESWDIGEGYSIHVVDVSIERSNARLQLYRNETLLEDEIVSASNYITHEETLLDRDIDVFSAKVDGVFVGNSKFVVLTNVNLIAGDQKVVDGDFTLLQTAISAKYLTLDGSITVGEEPDNFHAATVTPGGYSPDCISCHTGDGVAPIKLDLDDFKEGVHVNLNNDTTYTSFITDDANKACWGCHGNSTGGEPDEHPTPYLGNHTPKSCITCHGNSLFGAKQIYSHYPGAEISTSGTCWDCHSNNQNNSKPQNAVASASHYSAKKNLLNTSDCAVCHGDETNATLWGNAPMVSKHNSSNDCALCHAGEGIKTFHDKGITITRNCEDCHVDKQQAEKFNLTPILTHYPGAPEGKANTLENNDYTCRVCHNATNNSLHSDMEVREYQNESMGFCFPCHSVDGEFPHKSDTQLEEVLHGSGIKVVMGCDSCHAAEGVSKYHTPTALGKSYMRGTVKYDIECTECHPEHEGREYQPYEGIQCEDCHDEYGSVHYAGLTIGQSETTTSTCPLCHNEDADRFHELTHIVGNVSEEAYEPCGDCHDDIDALMDYSSSASIMGGTMGTISQPDSSDALITCTSCHNSSGMNSFHYDAYPMGTVQNPGWENWTAGNVTGCKDCHTYQGGAAPFNATNMGTQGRSPAGTAHGFAPSCTICHGGDDSISFHILATSEFIPRIGATIEPSVVYGGEVSLLQVTVVLPQLTKLTRAEYFIDVMGRDGYGLPLEYIVGRSDESSAVLGAVINTSELSYDKHPIFVHVKDSSGKWSKTEAVILTVKRPGGVAAVEVILKDIVPVVGVAGLLYLIWRRFR